VTIGNDASCLSSQVNALGSRVIEALLLFLLEHLLHTSSCSFIVCFSPPVTVPTIPAPVTNFTINAFGEGFPGTGTPISQTTPDTVCSIFSKRQTAIETKDSDSDVFRGKVLGVKLLHVFILVVSGLGVGEHILGIKGIFIAEVGVFVGGKGVLFELVSPERLWCVISIIQLWERKSEAIAKNRV